MKNRSSIFGGLALLAITLTGAVLAEPPKPRPPVVQPPILDPGVIGPVIHHLSGRELAQRVDGLLASAQMKLNNHRDNQTSFVEVMGVRFNFSIPRVVVDIDCGTFCPDFGDGHFYLNDINLSRADFAARTDIFTRRPYFLLSLEMEDSGREIKGYHNRLGDDAMPDFQMDRMRLGIRSVPVVVNGALSLSFTSANLTADIQSTGGCNIAGVDLCNKIFGTNRKIESGVENATKNALNGSAIQGALQLAIRQYLQSRGISGAIRTLRWVEDDLQLVMQ